MSRFIDCISLFSIVGIWPRYIEPSLLFVTRLKWQLNEKSAHLNGLKILHFSDLHFHKKSSRGFLKKIGGKIASLEPDLLLFTGDFICYSRLDREEELLSFLGALKAPLGKFCIFGNHDYARYVSVNAQGIYAPLQPPRPLQGLKKGIKAMRGELPAASSVAEETLQVPPHEKLPALLAEAQFALLENRSHLLPCGLNLVGLGDLGLGRCHPDKAFASYNAAYPGIILSHNPDSVPHLLPFPGEWILSGHTHGEQIHIPWPKGARTFSRRLTRLGHLEYTRGLISLGEKLLYVNRGLGSFKPFRLGSPPEICLIEARL
jgi:uncharacterized protein